MWLCLLAKNEERLKGRQKELTINSWTPGLAMQPIFVYQRTALVRFEKKSRSAWRTSKFLMFKWFYSILSCKFSILFYSILFYSILSFLFCILFYLAVKFSIMFYSVFYSIMYSILFYLACYSFLFFFFVLFCQFYHAKSQILWIFSYIVNLKPFID